MRYASLSVMVLKIVTSLGENGAKIQGCKLHDDWTELNWIGIA